MNRVKRILLAMIKAEVWLILLMHLAFLPMVAFADCSEFEVLTREAIELRMIDIVKIDHKARNQMEQDMLNNLFQWARPRAEHRLPGTMDRFVSIWSEACRLGWYR